MQFRPTVKFTLCNVQNVHDMYGVTYETKANQQTKQLKFLYMKNRPPLRFLRLMYKMYMIHIILHVKHRPLKNDFIQAVMYV